LDNNIYAEEPIFGGSLRYGFSNKNAIIIAGLAGLIIFFIIWIGLVAGVLAKNTIVILITIGIILILVLAILVLINGYTIRCARKILQGQPIAPDISNNLHDMALDGIKSLPIYIEGLLYGMIIYIPYYLLVRLSNSRGISALSCLLIILLLLVNWAFGVINRLQMVVYADTGSVLKGMNPLIPLKLCLNDPHSYVSAYLVSLIVQVVYIIPVIILVMLICTSILTPFLYLPMIASGIYVITRYYRRMSGDGLEGKPVVEGKQE
jgi:hypothetical protein